jgi:hypothetical protein
MPTPLIPQLSYVSVFDADDYFSVRLDPEVWNAATPARKFAALVAATRAIDNLNFVGAKADPAQPQAWPRMGPTDLTGGMPGMPTAPIPVPVEVLMAVCEEAFIRLDGLDIELEIDGVGVVTTTYAGVRESYDRTTISEGVRAGIGSNVAWNFLVPWLADGQSLYLARV